ncbi:MAG TPA: S8 family serine peptidase [Vicinamibacterales bacterium]|nr:S8 family serine peptidase [Vicinamibacterales bacterium]
MFHPVRALFSAAAAVALGTIIVTAQQPGVPDQAQPPIRLRAATFTPTRGESPAIPPGLTIAGYNAGQRGYYLVQFNGPIVDAWKAQVAAVGADVLEYVPEFAFKVRMNPAQARQVEALSSVAWVGLFHPAYKLGPELVRNGVHAYTVRIEQGVNAAAVAAIVAAAGAQILQREGSIITLTADSARLDAIAHVLDVASIENLHLRQKQNEFGGGAIIGAGTANAGTYDGSTQTVAVADTGLGNGTAAGAFAHIESSRIGAIFNWPGVSGGCFTSITNDGAIDVDSGHGTHTTVSAVGAGGAGGVGRGTAPAARLVFQALENWATTSGFCKTFYGAQDGYYLVGIPSDIRQLFQQAFDAGARIHSNSWGSDSAGAYTTDSLNADSFIWSNPDMAVTFSAGNAGIDANSDGIIDADSMGSPATAKNVISVGASESDRQGHWECDATLTYTTCAAQGGQNTLFTYGAAWPADYPAEPIKGDPSAGNPEQMAAFSSRGPADDGRIKPDVVAPGTWILSGYSDAFQQKYDPSANPQNGQYQYDGWGFPFDANYKYMGGTSMSNPLVAGGAAVVRDFYAKAAGHNASAALVKATLVNSAVDLLDENNDGLSDNANPIPNRHEGWGRVNLAAATDGSRRFVDGTTLTTNTTVMYAVAVTGTTFKATLAWSDYPSTTSAAKNLVNDLDLIVRSPDGTATYLGNVFAGGWSQTGGAVDRTNNIENVYIQGAAAGTWTVEVRGYNVPSGPQPFSLVVTGTFAVPAAPAAPANLVAAPASSSRIDLTWSDNSTDETGFEVERCQGSGCINFAKIAQVGAGVTAYANTGLTAGTTYQYRVRAMNNGVASAYSNVAAAATQTASYSHVGDLDRSATSLKNGWTASATIAVHDSAHAAVSGATVSGNWSGGYAATATCTTGTNGQCSVTTGTITKNRSSVTFSVTGVGHSTLIYQATSNHDPDNDSNGTAITVTKP